MLPIRYIFMSLNTKKNVGAQFFFFFKSRCDFGRTEQHCTEYSTWTFCSCWSLLAITCCCSCSCCSQVSSSSSSSRNTIEKSGKSKNMPRQPHVVGRCSLDCINHSALCKISAFLLQIKISKPVKLVCSTCNPPNLGRRLCRTFSAFRFNCFFPCVHAHRF